MQKPHADSNSNLDVNDKCKGYVLLSGGIDSSTCLFISLMNHMHTQAYSIDYGQVHRREIDAAANICHRTNTPHHILKLSPQPRSPLTDPNINATIPDVTYSELPKGISPSYHHYRNGQLLSLIAAYAVSDLQGEETGIIYAGQHAEDAQNWAYADCTPEFLGCQATAIFIGSYQRIRLATPLMWMMKHEIVTLGSQLGVPWELTYSCYHGKRLHCGVCPTCRARKDAFAIANVDDPTGYEADLQNA